MYSRKRKQTYALSNSTQQLSMSLTPPGAKLSRIHLNELHWLDVSEFAIGTGFLSRVEISTALSDALFAGTTEIDDDYDQRLWDLLWLAHFKLSLDQSPSVAFHFSFMPKSAPTQGVLEGTLHLHAVVIDDLTRVGLPMDF